MLEQGDEPDMLLLDVMMPDMSGYSVCRDLRRKYPASVLPIVLLTVKTVSRTLSKALPPGPTII